MSGKHKVKINYKRFFCVIICFALAVALVIVGIVSLVKSRKSSVNKSNTSDTSISADSSSDAQSQAEPVKVDYETRVGKNYEIDITDYLQYIEPETDEYLFLVNPTHTLASDYVPDDLVDCGITRKDGRATQKLRKCAAKALEALMAEGAKNGVTNVTATSAYRSYDYQQYLFNLYCEQNQSKFKTREECEKYVLTFSTKPGTSEHQSGLCLDMHNISSAEVTFAQKPEAKWLAENCYRFGFILRYPEDKTEITGITFEPWHFRFVGREYATQMHEKNMCLEEYMEYLGK